MFWSHLQNADRSRSRQSPTELTFQLSIKSLRTSNQQQATPPTTTTTTMNFAESVEQYNARKGKAAVYGEHLESWADPKWTQATALYLPTSGEPQLVELKVAPVLTDSLVAKIRDDDYYMRLYHRMHHQL